MLNSIIIYEANNKHTTRHNTQHNTHKQQQPTTQTHTQPIHHKLTTHNTLLNQTTNTTPTFQNVENALLFCNL